MVFVLSIKGEIKGVYSTWDKAWDKGWEMTEECKKGEYTITQHIIDA